MQRSETIGKIADALAKAQGEFPPIPRTRTATIPGKDGRAGFSYDYADLGDIMTATRSALSKNGLAILNDIGSDGGSVLVTASLLHSSGEWLQTDPFILAAGTSPQSAGSSVAYARRYTTSALLGIATEQDDDGAMATHSAAASPNIPVLASEAQIKKVYVLARKLEISDEALHKGIARDFNGKEHTGDLTKAEASKLIDKLSKLEKAQKEAEKAAAQAEADSGQEAPA